MDEEITISIKNDFVIGGNTGILKCLIPNSMKKYVHITSWYKDNIPIHNDEKYSLFPTGELHIRNVDKSDGYARYTCRAINILTNVTKLSESHASIIISEPSNSLSPRISDFHSVINVNEGEDMLEIPCAAQAWPLPQYKWYKISNKDGMRHLLQPLNNIKFLQRKGSLIIFNINNNDEGKYVCLVYNVVGEISIQTIVNIIKPLKVKISSDHYIIQENGRVEINCSVSGDNIDSVKWLHNGNTLVANDNNRHITSNPMESILIINKITSNHIGIYQCIASDQYGQQSIDQSTVSLGDISPFILESFTSKVVNIGDNINLKCIASGTPLPMITWTLDGYSLDDIKNQFNALNHAMWGDYVVFGKGQMISHVNITIESVSDGGYYECTARNKGGTVGHGADIQVNGNTQIRTMLNRTGIASRNIFIPCWILGKKPEKIQWEKDDRLIPFNHRHRVYNNGTLQLINLNRHSDTGRYTCLAVTENHIIARSSFFLQVLNPPVIEDFNFDSKLESGMRTRIYCNIAQGDQPVKIEWYKDNQLIVSSEDIIIKRIDEYSYSLMIDSLNDQHNGNYTCKATNKADTVNHTAILKVNVPPLWIIKPKSTTVTEGHSIIIDCSAHGYPLPQITWKHIINNTYELIRSGPHYQVYENGTLRISKTQITDRGDYLCQASNGIGSGLSTMIQLKVNAPVYFSSSSHENVTTIIGIPVTLECNPDGDRPINIKWLKNERPLNNTPIVKLSTDNGIYKCIASNPYGTATKIYTVIIKEPPNPPVNLKITSKSSRTLQITWSNSFNGNSPITGYIISAQYHLLSFSLSSSSREEAIKLKNITVTGTIGILRNLLPSTNYTIRVYAINIIGTSNSSEILNAITDEESPGGPPLNTKVITINSTSLYVEWSAPLNHLHNGQLKGYYVGYKIVNTSDHFIYKTITNITINSITISSLRPYTTYIIIIQAFNSIGAGPRCDELFAKTLPDLPSYIPNDINCIVLSSKSIKVKWSASNEWINGPFKGYRIRYKRNISRITINNAINNNYYYNNDSDNLSIVSMTPSFVLNDLHAYTNYSISVNVINSIGDGPLGRITCLTKEDTPSSPTLKLAPLPPETIYASWKIPLYPNGIIRSYTLYRSKDDIIEKWSIPNTSFRTSAFKGVEYKYWVTATTGAGEGSSSQIMKIIMKDTAPAVILQFGGYLEKPDGSAIDLPCSPIGTPLPQITWFHNNALLNATSMLPFSSSSLDYPLIFTLNPTTIGNYTCRASNTHGTDSVTYFLRLSSPPLSPIKILSTNNTSIKFAWTGPIGNIYYRALHSKEWSKMLYKNTNSETSFLHSSSHIYVLDNLICGTVYQIYISTIDGSTDPIRVKTRGREPIPSPSSEFIIRINSSTIKLNPNSWSDGGCPITETVVKWRKSNGPWILMQSSSSLYLNNLIPNILYKIRVLMKNSAGTTNLEYDFRPQTFESVYQSTFDGTRSIRSTDSGSLIFTCFLIAILILLASFIALLGYKGILKRNPSPTSKTDCSELSVLRSERKDFDENPYQSLTLKTRKELARSATQAKTPISALESPRYSTPKIPFDGFNEFNDIDGVSSSCNGESGSNKWIEKESMYPECCIDECCASKHWDISIGNKVIFGSLMK